MIILEAAYNDRHTKMESVQDMMFPVFVEVKMAAIVVNDQEMT